MNVTARMLVGQFKAISIPDIDEAAGIGVRALESRPSPTGGRTPIPAALLYEIRLSYARHELLQSADRPGGARGGPLGNAAPGRFAAHYVERFGESPSSTLTRARVPASSR